MGTTWIGVGALSAFLGVALGAFGAHGLADKLDAHALAIYETAVRYQMYHAMGLVGFGLWLGRSQGVYGSVPGWSFAIGTLLFSGSLYALALSGFKLLGAVTPFGGIAFLVGWASFAWQALAG